MTAYHIFTRRTPRTLHVIASSREPMFTRRGTKRILNWTNVDRNGPHADVLRAAINAVTVASDRRTLETDFARAADALHVSGWRVEHKPASAMFAERITLTQEA